MQPSLRYNVEIARAGESGDEDTTQNYLQYKDVSLLMRTGTAGDAFVVNVVEGPGPGEI